MAGKEKIIGTVTHWYDKIGVAVVALKSGLKVGDKVKVKHGETEFETEVESMQVEHENIKSSKKGEEVAVKLSEKVEKAKEGSVLYEVGE